MARTFDLDLLRTVVSVCELESFAAAKHVHRTQSAVTEQMQRLEKQVGVRLFRRSGRLKALTRHGQTLLDCTRRIRRGARRRRRCRSSCAHELSVQ